MTQPQHAVGKVTNSVMTTRASAKLQAELDEILAPVIIDTINDLDEPLTKDEQLLRDGCSCCDNRKIDDEHKK